jgi:hypothetical protein
MNLLLHVPSFPSWTRVSQHRSIDPSPQPPQGQRHAAKPHKLLGLAEHEGTPVDVGEKWQEGGFSHVDPSSSPLGAAGGPCCGDPPWCFTREFKPERASLILPCARDSTSRALPWLPLQPSKAEENRLSDLETVFLRRLGSGQLVGNRRQCLPRLVVDSLWEGAR